MAKSLWQVNDELWIHSLDDPNLSFMDLYVDSDNGLSAIFTSEGRLMRGSVQLDDQDQVQVSTLEPVLMQFTATNRQKPITRIQSDGTIAYTRISGVAILNRSGELDSTALFDSLIDNFDVNAHYPLLFYHDETLPIGRVTGLHREGYVLIEYGILDDPTTNILAKRTLEAWQNDSETWGASISFYPTEMQREKVNGIEIPIYTSGTFKESSLVRADDAAHFHTGNSNFISQ